MPAEEQRRDRVRHADGDDAERAGGAREPQDRHELQRVADLGDGARREQGPEVAADQAAKARDAGRVRRVADALRP
jgi:hypothetical protein